MARSRLKLFFDGGARPNPGQMEAAVVIRGAVHLFEDMGQGSNTDAEWLALIHALKLARTLGLTDVEFIGDSREVVLAANAALRSGHASGGHAATMLALIADTRPARIRWIKREQNLAGIALEARYR
ncbi:reverse transcriptase-like protein [Altererythrobacter xixiisoli]|uniref:Reverse transcriptase-like protein n=1 Tax=Croceibacterium xixiisoli TaxID=1476466 RepID=A0A6I4TTK0_9SPHN|nr:reverse transcriptase-like protein [Croceibacterium xixiisoli]MXO99505.1 reverse transcriptase-like protein [Croceibacterium xixiisoli]